MYCRKYDREASQESCSLDSRWSKLTHFWLPFCLFLLLSTSLLGCPMPIIHRMGLKLPMARGTIHFVPYLTLKFRGPRFFLKRTFLLSRYAGIGLDTIVQAHTSCGGFCCQVRRDLESWIPRSTLNSLGWIRRHIGEFAFCKWTHRSLWRTVNFPTQLWP